MASAWYYTRDGKHKEGPVSSPQLRELAQSRILLPTDMIWKEGMAKWVPARDFTQLFDGPPAAETDARGAGKHAASRTAASLTLASQYGFYSIAVDPSRWKMTDPLTDVAEFSWIHESGRAFAMMVPEWEGTTMEALKSRVIDTCRQLTTQFRVVRDKFKIVNGVQVMNLGYEGILDNQAAISWYGYFWTGEAGTLQALAWSEQRHFAELLPDMKRLLNGLKVTPKPAGQRHVAPRQPTANAQPAMTTALGGTFTRFRIERVACILTLTLIAMSGVAFLDSDRAGYMIAALIGIPLWLAVVFSLGRNFGMCGGYTEEFVEGFAPPYAFTKFSFAQYMLEFGILVAIILSVIIMYAVGAAIRQAFK